MALITRVYRGVKTARVLLGPQVLESSFFSRSDALAHWRDLFCFTIISASWKFELAGSLRLGGLRRGHGNLNLLGERLSVTPSPGGQEAGTIRPQNGGEEGHRGPGGDPELELCLPRDRVPDAGFCFWEILLLGTGTYLSHRDGAFCARGKLSERCDYARLGSAPSYPSPSSTLTVSKNLKETKCIVYFYSIALQHTMTLQGT